MKKLLLPVLLIFVSCKFIGCKKDDPSVNFPTNAVVIKKVYDVGNNVNASDVRVDLSFDPSVNLSDITEIRLIISKSSLTNESAQALSAGSYQNISTPSSADQVGRFQGTTKDADGAAIANDVDYKLYAALTGRGNAFLLSKPLSFTLQNKPIYSGEYKGIWNDAIAKDFGVTMRLFDDYSGVLYYTTDFTTCCPRGGTSDATVKFVFNGTTITSFVANQRLGNYKGGNCEATYNATGSVTDEITLMLTNLTGTDCDGDHAPGTVKFTRQ